LSTPKNGIRARAFEASENFEGKQQLQREESLESKDPIGSTLMPIGLRPNVMMRITNSRKQTGRNHNGQEVAKTEVNSR
jgi:outer membrane biogenesis lipoprotein LolB